MEPIPERIGKFQVEAVIGRGAMGVVYKAKDPFIGRLVALKRISLSDLLPEDQKAEFKERFFVEARAAGGLKHPNIVVIHELGEADGAPYMAMEFVEGGSLAKLMKTRGPLPLDETIAITRQVALGLAYAHGKGVIHRDVKPDNILLDKNGRVVITDFGAAHLLSSELTRTGEVLGTPHYMSPEQILGDPVDGRSDLFSLGVVFYLLLTGRRPFKGDTITTVCYHIVNSPPEPVPEGINIPQEVLPILQQLLAKSGEDRFQTGLEVVEALNRLQSRPEPQAAAQDILTQTWDIATPTPGTQRVPLTQARPREALHAKQAGPEQVNPQAPSPLPLPKSGKGLWIGLGIGAGALVVGLGILVAVVLVVLALRGTGRAEAPAPAAPEQTGPVTPTAPPPSSQQRQPQAGAETPVSPGLKPAKPPGPRSSTPPQRPPASPEQSAPPPASPSPQVLAATEALIQDAGQVAALAERRRFGKAFATLDEMQSRLNQLKISASPQDETALRSASRAIADASDQTKEALAAASKPILDKGNAIVDEATEGAGTDEDAIIAAYADVYPVIRWKDRLPDDLRLSVEAFMRRCREELNDDEWARAHALGQGRSFPGQS